VSKVSVKAKPTFFAKVTIPAPEGALVLDLEFKHRTRKEFDAYIQQVQSRTAEGEGSVAEVDQVLELVAGWRNVEEPFSKEAVADLLENFHAASRTIGSRYHDELTQARLGN
jgi:hypothetical protein